MATEDPDRPQASEDGDIQSFLDTQWYAALGASGEAMDALRKLYPLMSTHLPETAGNLIKTALNSAENAHLALHTAGPYVIGGAQYDDLLDEQTRRIIKD